MPKHKKKATDKSKKHLLEAVAKLLGAIGTLLLGIAALLEASK